VVNWHIFPVLINCTKKNLATLPPNSFFHRFLINSAPTPTFAVVILSEEMEFSKLITDEKSLHALPLQKLLREYQLE
jgi:hypothetical protein